MERARVKKTRRLAWRGGQEKEKEVEGAFKKR